MTLDVLMCMLSGYRSSPVVINGSYEHAQPRWFQIVICNAWKEKKFKKSLFFCLKFFKVVMEKQVICLLSNEGKNSCVAHITVQK